MREIRLDKYFLSNFRDNISVFFNLSLQPCYVLASHFVCARSSCSRLSISSTDFLKIHLPLRSPLPSISFLLDVYFSSLIIDSSGNNRIGKSYKKKQQYEKDAIKWRDEK